MVYFHLFYDLHVFNIVKIDLGSSFWYNLPRLIVTLFLACQAITLKMLHEKNRWNLKRLKKQLTKLFLGAFAISCSTYFLYPDRWVYFGTLHCIFFTTLFTHFFRNKALMSFFFGALILLSYFFFPIKYLDLKYFINRPSMDYIPLYPWLGLSLICVSLPFSYIPKISFPKKLKFLLLPSKYSFEIYLMHQPILFGTTALIHKIFLKA